MGGGEGGSSTLLLRRSSLKLWPDALVLFHRRRETLTLEEGNCQVPVIRMNTCSCGKIAEVDSTRCTRCAALKTLELEAGATSEEIRNSFHVLAKAWHPDRFQTDAKMRELAEEKLKALNAAFSLLAKPLPQAEPYRSEAGRSTEEAHAESASASEASEQATTAKRLGYWGFRSRFLTAPIAILAGCGTVVALVAIAWILFKPIDSALTADPVKGKFYAEYKESLWSGIDGVKNKIRDEVRSSLGSVISQKADAAPPSIANDDAASAPAPTERKPGQRQVNAPHGREHRVLPFITAGLTMNEVIEVEGTPTSESDDKLVYGKSEFYFSDDSLIGWKIDPASAPVRVKLWPDAMVDPSLSSFGVGSTKNDVLVVQGTPTFFSENTFGYGNSEVHFQNNRVASWKSDPSWPLRTVAR